MTDTIKRLETTRDNAGSMSLAEIMDVVASLASLTVSELSAIQRGFLGAAIGASKKAKLESLETVLVIANRDARRVADILAS